MGDVLCESGRCQEALGKYERAVELVQKSDLSSQIKENAALTLYYTSGYVAARTGDLAGALVKARQYLRGTQALDNPNLIRLAHQLAAVIALESQGLRQGDRGAPAVQPAEPVQSLPDGAGLPGQGRHRQGQGLCRAGSELQRTQQHRPGLHNGQGPEAAGLALGLGAQRGGADLPRRGLAHRGRGRAGCPE